MNWWVVSAKQEETRLKRLDKLIEEIGAGKTHQMTRPDGSKYLAPPERNRGASLP